jgi:hypothetical protein
MVHFRITIKGEMKSRLNSNITNVLSSILGLSNPKNLCKIESHKAKMLNCHDNRIS